MNVYDVPDVVWVDVAGLETIEYDVALVPATHESEMLGFDVEPVWTIDDTGPAAGADVYDTFVLDVP